MTVMALDPCSRLQTVSSAWATGIYATTALGRQLRPTEQPPHYAFAICFDSHPDLLALGLQEVVIDPVNGLSVADIATDLGLHTGTSVPNEYPRGSEPAGLAIVSSMPATGYFDRPYGEVYERRGHKHAPRLLSAHFAIANADVDTPPRTIAVSTTLFPNQSPGKIAVRRRTTQALRDALAELDPAIDHVLTGDLNTSPFQRPLQKAHAGWERRTGGHVTGKTWRYPRFPLIAANLDYVLTRGAVEIKAIKTLPRTGSDHSPLIASMRLAD